MEIHIKNSENQDLNDFLLETLAWINHCAVQKELHELNLTLDNAKEIAQERQKWTDIVDGAMSNDWWKASMMMMSNN